MAGSVEQYRLTGRAMDSPVSRTQRIRSAIDEYQSRLIGFAARITGDAESARDVVQDTFLRLCREDLDVVGDHLPAWLFRVCRNRALDVRKKEAPLRRLDDVTSASRDGLAEDPHHLLAQGDDARRVLCALAELPAAQQEVLRLRFQEELSYKEISAVTGHTIGRVGFLIHAGIKRLRRTLRPAAPAIPMTGERTDA
jgi:RNA polymerase sigma-70 factor (ECF subfamily)